MVVVVVGDCETILEW